MQALKRSYLFLITFSKEWWLEDFKSVRTNDDWSFTRMLLALKNNFGIAHGMTSGGDATKRQRSTTYSCYYLWTLWNPTLMSSIHRWRGWFGCEKDIQRFGSLRGFRICIEKRCKGHPFWKCSICYASVALLRSLAPKSFGVKYFTNFRWTSSRVIAWKTFIHHE